ncbi:cytoskeleton protein RodZ [Tistlia consotensis]|uniref:Cytoskeleton protein RodZ n=1 Tax=Tistlia consotensis USBA 355 TaxID=560819 RepID=A0A1Y6BY77_9PROT|nr:RodZ domain-containing protein [Tistlia consotensis]SMF33723.1 cytoskeleton protein RodZ [Tistlia consotensis USBA 355]SNR70213.1 cytoskeleton protein RodZ [Tistlia consotensis]
MRHKATAEAEHRHAADNVEPFIGGPSRSVGELLRNAREDLGLELRQVSETLRIRYAHLRALEEGQLSELPGQTYAVGFVRTYADYLGLDSRAMVERFKEEMSGIPRSTQLVFPTPKPEGKIPGGALVMISLLLVGLAYGGWYAFNEFGDELNSLIVRETPPGATSQTPTAAKPATQPAAPKPAAPMAAAPKATAPAAPTRTAPAQTALAPAAPKPAAPAATASGAAGTARTAPAPSAMAEAPSAAPADGTASPPEEEDVAPVVEETVPDTGGQAQVVEPSSETAPEAGTLPESQSAPEVAAPAESLPSVSPGNAPPSSSTTSRAALAEAPAGEAVQDVAPQAAPEPQPQAASEPSPQTTVAREEAIPVPPIPSTGEAGQAGRAARVFGTANTGARIVLRATADSWVQVRNARSDLLFTQVLRAGDSYNVPNEPGLTLLTGNAGGLQVLVDGKPAPALGPSGAVRRDITLDPDSLLRGAQ